jgi:hypothetical protein
MAKLLPDSHLVAAFRNRTNTLDAISEFIDNADDVGATHFNLSIGKEIVVAIDNGQGTDDPDLLFGFGHSKSKRLKSAIGRFGIGAKEAMLHFGSLVEVETVCAQKYRKHTVDYDKVERSGWPDKYVGRALPIGRAPQSIANGGTLIRILRLTSGRSRIFPDILVKRLSHRFRLGLRKGISIEITFIDGQILKLSPDADMIGIWKNEKEIIGKAVGRDFVIRYTDLKEYDPNLTGIHIGYGNRFIEQIKKLDGKTLPPLFYAEVILGEKWKNCLSPNKTSVRKYHDELEAAIHAFLKEWIKELETYSDEARIEKLNVLLHKATAQILSFKKDGTEFARGRKVTGYPEGDGPSSDIGPHIDREEANPDNNGDGGKEIKRRPAGGLFFKPSSELGDFPFEIETDTRNNQITVKLNEKIPAIDLAYRVPYKISALWPLISAALAGWCRQNLESIDELLPGLLDRLKAEGYRIDLEKPEDLECYLITWLMKQHPPSVQELEKLQDVS